MREVEERVLETICADNPQDFQKQYNSTLERLKVFQPKIEKYFWNDQRCADFEYVKTQKIAETTEDDFMQHNARCTCSDCPFLQVGTDARRKWFPCEYSEYGETRIDSPACEQFYKQAIALMRKEAGR